MTERAQVDEKLRVSRAQLAALSRQLITAQETERRHLARELHDEIGQVLTAVHISLQQVRGVCDSAAWPRLDESAGIVKGAIQQVRDLSLNLRPAILDDFGLEAALRWYLETQRQQTGCAIDFQAQSTGAALPPELTSACFRIVQEAVTNVQRHARAQHVWVKLEQTDDYVRLVVRDDGVGFDAEAVRRRAAAGRSFGVLGMQERAELLGGQFELRSAPGQGCEAQVRLPIAKTEGEDEEMVRHQAEPIARSERP